MADARVVTRRLPFLDGVELKDATFAGMSFPPHFHEAVSIGVVESGMEQLQRRGTTIIVPTGALVVVDAGEVHAHAAVDVAPWRYRALYVSPDVIADRRRRRGLTGSRLPAALRFDASLVATFRILRREAEVVRLLDALLDGERDDEPVLPETPMGAADMQEAAAVLREAGEARLSTNALARRFRLGPYQLVRAFRAVHGVTPAAFQMIERVNRARQLLFGPMSVAEVALAAGFFDQSHLVRHFKRYTGTTPSGFRRSIVDGPPPDRTSGG
jgi:AraC-like DNA-binding protein